MNKLTKEIRGCTLCTDDNKAVLKVPKTLPVLGAFLSQFAEGGAFLALKNNENLMEIVGFIAGLNGYLKQTYDFEPGIWIYTDAGNGEAVIYKRKNCSVKIVSEEIILTITKKPTVCPQCVKNIEKVAKFLKKRENTKKVIVA